MNLACRARARADDFLVLLMSLEWHDLLSIENGKSSTRIFFLQVLDGVLDAPTPQRAEINSGG